MKSGVRFWDSRGLVAGVSESVVKLHCKQDAAKHLMRWQPLLVFTILSSLSCARLVPAGLSSIAPGMHQDTTRQNENDWMLPSLPSRIYLCICQLYAQCCPQSKSLSLPRGKGPGVTRQSGGGLLVGAPGSFLMTAPLVLRTFCHYRMMCRESHSVFGIPAT